MQSMLSKFYPFEYLEDVYSIDYDALFMAGFRGLIFDIDNTLVPHGKDSEKEVDELFHSLKEKGFKTLLLSNNGEQRVMSFCKNIDTLYIANAGKPSPDCFRKAMQMMGTTPETTIMIGDTTFTDIVGANAAGIPSILVKYIGFYKKEWKGFKRNIERVVLLCYKHSRFNHRLKKLIET